jgi:hypothetical protein
MSMPLPRRIARLERTADRRAARGAAWTTPRPLDPATLELLEELSYRSLKFRFGTEHRGPRPDLSNAELMARLDAATGSGG